MIRRVEFRLSMPSRGSWDGGWNGEDRNYVVVRWMNGRALAALIPEGTTASWYHRWDDGWGARITARVMAPGERPPKSDGFAGYDWMVDNILAYGSTYRTGTGEGMTPAATR